MRPRPSPPLPLAASPPPGTQSATGLAVNRDRTLAEVLVELARALGAASPVDAILDHLVVGVGRVVPVAGCAVVLLDDDGCALMTAATSEAVHELEAAQQQVRDGATISAWRTGEPVALDDLGTEPPAVAAVARGAGLRTAFAFPLLLDGQRLGALTLYRAEPGGLDPADARTAQTLAEVAAAYTVTARSRPLARIDLPRPPNGQAQLYDPLTGLPNGTLLSELLEQAASRSSSRGVVAVLNVDLDDFSTLNDTLGRHVGDQLLKAVPMRLRQVLRSGDFIARTSDDEFAVVCEGLSGYVEADQVGRRVAYTLAQPFMLDGQLVEVSASVGLAYSGPTEDMPGTLLRAATSALDAAKHDGGARRQGPAGMAVALEV